MEFGKESRHKKQRDEGATARPPLCASPDSIQPPITGNSTSVKISVTSQNGGPVVVEILDPTTLMNGTWSLLAYAMISPRDRLSCSPTCELVSASFSPPVPQVAGKQYGIAVYPAYVVHTWFGSIGLRNYAGWRDVCWRPFVVDITLLYSNLPIWE